MKDRLIRAVYLLLTGSTSALGAYGFWTLPTSFPFDHLSLYGLSAAPLCVMVIGFVASFSVFDKPQSALRWSAPLSGIAIGVTLGGLVLFTPTFLWLALPLLIYAGVLRSLARAITRMPPPRRTGVSDMGRVEPPPPPKDEEPETDEAGDDPIGKTAPPSYAEPSDEDDPLAKTEPPSYAKPPGEDEPETVVPGHVARRGVNLSTAVFAVLGVALTWVWMPHGAAARPEPLDSTLHPATYPPKIRLRSRRIVRKTDVVEVNGNEVQVKLGLRRPRLRIELRDQVVYLEPCLNLEEATTDGFFWLPPLNGYRLEPTGLALVELAEGRSRAWVRATYEAGKARYLGKLAGIAPGAGRRAGEADISATIDLEVELDTGRITVDAVTRLSRSATVHEGTLCWVRVDKTGGPRPLRFGIAEGADLFPRGTGITSPLQFISTDSEVARVLEAKRGDEGPYQPLSVGPFEGWVVLPGKIGPLLLLVPDWARQASHARSRCAGYGLTENSILTWYEDDGITLIFDVASTRLGPGKLSTVLPPGRYRNRVVLMPLGRDDPSVVARRQMQRLGAAIVRDTK